MVMTPVTFHTLQIQATIPDALSKFSAVRARIKPSVGVKVSYG